MAHVNRVITERHLWWLSLILISVIASIASFFLNPVFIIAGIFLILNLFFIARNPFYGVIVYLIIFLLRPGELFPMLAPLRIELVIGTTVLLLYVLREKLVFGRLKLPGDRITFSLVAFLIVLCLTIFVSYYKSFTVDTVVDFIKILVFYYLIVAMVKTRQQFVIFNSILVLLIGYIAFDAFKGYMAGDFVRAMNVDRMASSSSAGGDPNTLAGTLGATIPLVMAVAFYFRSWLVKIGLFMLSGFMAVLIILTASRSGMLSFMGVLFGGFIFSKNKFAVLLVGIFLLIGAWTVMPDQYKARYLTLTNVENVDETSSGRWEIWKAGVKMIAERPFLGVGAGVFSSAAGSGDFGYNRYMQAHNLYIQIFATTGILGFTVWFAFVYFFIKKLREIQAKVKINEKLQWMSSFGKGFSVAMIALFISGIFGHGLYRWTWYMMAGLTVSLGYMVRAIESEEEES